MVKMNLVKVLDVNHERNRLYGHDILNAVVTVESRDGKDKTNVLITIGVKEDPLTGEFDIERDERDNALLVMVHSVNDLAAGNLTRKLTDRRMALLFFDEINATYKEKMKAELAAANATSEDEEIPFYGAGAARKIREAMLLAKQKAAFEEFLKLEDELDLWAVPKDKA